MAALHCLLKLIFTDLKCSQVDPVSCSGAERRRPRAVSVKVYAFLGNTMGGERVRK